MCGEAQLALVPPVLPGEARCTEWFRWSNDCQIVYDPAADPDPIPVPTIIYEDGGIYSWSRPCSCGSGMTGTCRLNYERDTEWRVFVLRPGEPEIRTRIPHRDHGDARFVGRVENCVPIQLPPPPVCTPPQVDDGHGGCVTPPQTPTSGTEACPAGFTGTATWTQQPGQARVYDYSGCTPDGNPIVTPTSGTEACSSPWSGTASWTQQPGEARVYDYSSCSQSGTQACPAGQTGTVSWTQSWGLPQDFDYTACVGGSLGSRRSRVRRRVRLHGAEPRAGRSSRASRASTTTVRVPRLGPAAARPERSGRRPGHRLTEAHRSGTMRAV